MTTDEMRTWHAAGYTARGAEIMRAGSKVQNLWRRLALMPPTMRERERPNLIPEIEEAWDDFKRLCREVK